MKNQYVGDIGDYGKYALLRFLAKKGIRIGVNWYLSENDGGNDGKFTKYLETEEGRRKDPELFDALKKISFLDNKNVRMVEELGLISNAVYYGAQLSMGELEPKAREINRRLWFNNSKMLLDDTELIFADPDNGMLADDKSIRIKGSEKYVLAEEVKEYYEQGHNVVYYCHKGRRKWQAWEEAKMQMKRHLRDAQIIVLTYHKGTQRSYIFVVHPDDYQKYTRILREFMWGSWRDYFEIESIGNKRPGEEIVGEPFELELKDGSVVTISKRIDGTIEMKTSKKPNESHVIPVESFVQRLNL